MDKMAWDIEVIEEDHKDIVVDTDNMEEGNNSASDIKHRRMKCTISRI